MNFCIRQIREAVGDTADAPRFIETLPRRGYRFLLPVETQPSLEPKAFKRLIVLPFRMLRPDPETDFLAFSLPDALTTSLSVLKSLVVRSSLAASRFSGPAQDLKTMASEADVDLILIGTLLSAGGEIRVTAQLTDAANRTLVCSHFTQTSIGNVFRLQDELTECVVDALVLPLTAREQRILRQDVPANAKAYEYFLRGNQFSHDSKQWGAARDLYRRCVEADPCYAPGWARLGRIHHVMAKYLTTGSGFFCYPAMSSDPWLDPVRKRPQFAKLLGAAEQQHQVAEKEFARLEGNRILGIGTRPANAGVGMV